MKYLRMLGNVILYFMIYIFTTLLCSLTYGTIYIVRNNGIVDATELNSLLLKDQFTIATLAAILTFVIYILMFRKKEMNLFQRCKFRKLGLKNYLIVILSSIGLSFFSSGLVNLLINKFPGYSKSSEAIASSTTSLLGIISVVVIIPIFEEVLFRGLIFNEFKKHLNVIIAIIFQGIIFAVAHGNMLQGIYAFILGVVIAIIYVKTQSIIASMLFHIMFNLFGSILTPIMSIIIGMHHMVFLILGLILLAISLVLLFKNNVNADPIDKLYT